MKTPDEKDDLMGLLSPKTESKEIEDVEVDEPDMSDFEAEEEPEEADPEIDASEDEPDDDEEPDQNHLEDAESYVAILDMLNEFLIFPWVYRKALFSKEEWQKVRALRKRYKVKGKNIIIEELTDEERELLDRFQELEELKEDVELDDKERKMLEEAVARVLKKYKIKRAGPEMALAMAAIMVYAPRMSPVLYKSV